MQKYKNLTIIGTSHIAIESVNSIRSEITHNKPDIICLELDKNRFHALLQQQKHSPSFRAIKDLGLKGFLFLWIGSYVEKKLGQKVGLDPGAEMREAIHLAKEHHIAIALIDQDIRITLRKLRFTAKEKFCLLKDIFKSIFMRKHEIKRLGLANLDLSRVPETSIIDKMMREVRHHYPNFYKTLVTDRNKVMARKITALMRSYPDKKILAIVGAGHEKELVNLIRSRF